MKKMIRFIVLLSLVLQPGFGALLSSAAQGDQPPEQGALQRPASDAGGGMPGWPRPDKPVPHNQPGHLSKANHYTSQVEVPDEKGAIEAVPLSGLDAMAADRIDPLAGNYTLVSQDQVLRGGYSNPSLNLETLAITPTITTLQGSQQDLGNYLYNDLAAGDLNGDGQSEQVAAMLAPGSTYPYLGPIYLSTGELPGMPGKTKSAPAAVAPSYTEVHLLVRGYDDALWHCNYDLASGACPNWDNTGGGILLSGPAVASLGAGQFDAFVVGIDNQVYRRHWQGGWSSWQQYGNWPAPPPEWIGPAPELPPPAAVARNGGIDLFRLGPDNTLFWHDGTDWQSLGGMLASAPGVVSLSAGHMQVFARGVDDALWSLAYNNGWGQWQRLPMTGLSAGVTIASPPAAVSPAAGQIAVYVRGSDGQLWTAQGDGSNWSAWSATGGELASGPGAVAWSGATYLFAQTMDGLLESSQDGVSWVDLGGLQPCCTLRDTGLVGAPVYQAQYQDFSLDIESGHFWGDGRSQFALAYFSGANEVSIDVFENTERFKLISAAHMTLSQDIDYFSMATGDFLDGDGIDEIALVWVRGNTYNLDVIRVTSGGLTVAETGTQETVQIPDEDGDDYRDGHFAGTLQLASGDFDGDGQDELGVISVWRDSDWIDDPSCYSWLYSMRMRVFDLLKETNGGYDLKTYYLDSDTTLQEGAWWGEARQDRAAEFTGLAITAGDVNGDGKDELVRTWPDRFDNSVGYICGLRHQPLTSQLIRKLQVIILPDNPDKATGTWGDGIIKGVTPIFVDWGPLWTPSYQDRLAVSDLNRDLDGEIVWQMSDQLRTYQSDPDPQNPPTEPYQPYSTNLSLSATDYPKLVTGAFTGESVRVGPPSYRVQNRVDTLLTVINMPPKHRDLVKDSTGSYHEIVSPDETCTPTAGDPSCTHAKYATLNFNSSQQTVQTVHAYSLSAGMETKACGGVDLSVLSLKACLTNSINYTYGGNFEKSTDTISSVNYANTVIAGADDQLVYYGTPYAVWEYPVLTGRTGAADGFITVAFPLVSQTQSPGNLGGYLNPTCDENWYAPGHQLNNVWSYDPIKDPLTFKDYDPAYAPIYDVTIGDWGQGEITYTDFQSVLESNTFKHAVSVGMEYETSAKGKIKIVDLEGSFRASLNGSYENTSMESDVFKTENTTTYSYFLGFQTAGSKYQTRVLFYWSNNGYQVLNYQTEPGTLGSWGYYDKADPAFILPWYGFPDPATGQFPQSPDPDAPPCGIGKQLFSPDVQVSQRYASVGETVVISATVRNFSNVAPSPFTVKFYQGDPSQNVVIGQDTISGLTRQSGPKTAQVSWAASGAGRQNIYAVIDPGHTLPEVHDEDDWIDNNTAYTTIEIGSAAFVDRGVVEQQAYQGQSYSQLADMKLSFYLPSANLEAVSRFDLKDADQSVPEAIGRPFELVAFQGSKTDMWDEPLPKFDLTPVDGSPPAAISVAYSDASIAGHNEAELDLYQLTDYGWKKANLLCGFDTYGSHYSPIRFPQDNLLVVPVCETGVFVLADEQPGFTFGIYLPLVNQR